MANLCSTHVTLWGDTQLIDEVYNAIKTIRDAEPACWDLLAEFFGGATEEYSFIHYMEKGAVAGTTDSYIEFSLEDKWAPQVELFDIICKRYDGKLQYVYLAEESGCELFINTDSQGLFYKDKYYLDLCVDNTYETFSLCNWDELVNTLIEIIPELKDRELPDNVNELERVVSDVLQDNYSDDDYAVMAEYCSL